MEKLKKILNKNYKWIILFLCVVLFLAILQNVFYDEQLVLDSIFYNLVVQNMRTPTLTTILIIITNLGSAITLISLAILSIIFISYPPFIFKF